MQILGNGLLGRAFGNSDFGPDVLLLASGVSNSSETSSIQFGREESLVREALSTGKRLIYFSTCSVYGTSRTPYVYHKLKMESLVSEGGEDFAIIRLPQVVGLVRNTTLISYLVGRMVSSETVNIQESARRYLIAIEDVVRIVGELIRSVTWNGGIVNVSPLFSVSALEVARDIKRILKSDSLIEIIPGGESYEVEIPEIKSLLTPEDTILNRNYAWSVLRSYAPGIAALYNSDSI